MEFNQTLLDQFFPNSTRFWRGNTVINHCSTGRWVLALGNQLWITLVGVFVMGSFGALLLASIQALLADHYGPQQHIAFAEANISASFGAGASALLVATFAFVGIPWRWTLCIPMLILASCFVIHKRENLDRSSQSKEGNTRGSISPRPFLARFWIAWLVVVLVVSIEWCMTFWGASYLQRKLHLDAGGAALLLDLYLTTTVAGRCIGGRLSRIGVGSRLLFLALGGTLLGFFFFWLASSFLLTAVGLLVAGASISNLWPQAITLVFMTASEQPDRASARVSLAARIAICDAPLLLGNMANLIGLHIAYGIEPCLIILALIASGIVVMSQK